MVQRLHPLGLGDLSSLATLIQEERSDWQNGSGVAIKKEFETENAESILIPSSEGDFVYAILPYR